MPPNPAPKPDQVPTTIPLSPRRLRIARPVALPPSPTRHLPPLSARATHRHPKNFRRRLNPSPCAPPTHLPPQRPPHLSPIAQATTPTAMLPQLAIHPPRNPPAHGKTAFPPLQITGTHSPISMDPIPLPPYVKAWTKHRRRSRLRLEAKVQQLLTGIAVAVARSLSASRAINPIDPST